MGRLFQHTRGTVMLEFLMVMVPIMLLFLGTIQFAFIGAAKLALRHSANLAVRAASVVIEDSGALPSVDTNIYDGLAAGYLEIEAAADSEQSEQAQQATLASVQDAPRNQNDPKQQLSSLLDALDRSASRINQIRTAAYFPMLAVSPNAATDFTALLGDPLGDFTRRWAADDTVEEAIGGAGVERLVGAFLYNLGALAVTFEGKVNEDEDSDAFDTDLSGDPPDPTTATSVGDPDKIEFEAGEDVTVRVSYLFRCKVPIVSVFMCQSGWAIYMGSSWFDPQTYWELGQLVEEPPSSLAELPAWEQRLDSGLREFQKSQDERQASLDAIAQAEPHWKKVEVPLMQKLLLFRPAARYLVLSSDATLPLQSARYYPRLEEGS